MKTGSTDKLKVIELREIHLQNVFTAEYTRVFTYRVYFFPDDDDDIYDYEEAASYVTEAIYGNLEECSGVAPERENSIFASTIQSLVKSHGNNMRTLWSEMKEVKYPA